MSGNLSFETFASTVDLVFWRTFSEKKLEIFKLSDKPVNILGHYTCGSPFENTGSSLNLDGEAFSEKLTEQNYHYTLPGTIFNTNTLDSFKKIDFAKYLQDRIGELYAAIKSREALAHPEQFNRFHVCSYCELKEYVYRYWFLFPVILHPLFALSEPLGQASAVYDKEKLFSFNSQFKTQACLYDPTNLTVIPLTELPAHIQKQKDDNSKTIYLAVKDSGTSKEYPGWIVRNFLAAAAIYAQEVGLPEIKFELLFIREQAPGTLDLKEALFRGSLLARGTMKAFEKELSAPFPCSGWEKNSKGKNAPRISDLRQFFDQVQIADSAVDLNLRLMRWRLIPSLNLEKLKNTKCLLLGAGTLGCYVARILSGWGVRHITFVDRGKVSFSNPVRQPLFQYEHCLDGGRPKAITAAEQMKKILPTIDATGYEMTIHMPGHPVQPGEEEEECRKNVKKLEDLIRSHDAVFMLTDSREARWLPTLLCSYYGKIAINSALGFDTLVTMRHGHVPGSETIKSTPLEHICSEGASSSSSTEAAQPLPKEEAENILKIQEQPAHLGCYFCSDIVAPRNSFRERTLDQQCTVTRPGLAPIAAALAVEMMVCVVHHSKGALAPPGDENSEESSLEAARKDDSDDDDNPMKFVPHQIRVFMSRFYTNTYHFNSFPMCTACSSKVRTEYAKHGFDFLLRVFNDPEYLENLVGITEMMEKEKEKEAKLEAEAAERAAKGEVQQADDDDDFMLV